MNQQPHDEVLAAAELPAVRVFLATQNLLGQRAPAFTAPGVLALMAQLDTLSGAYPQLQNATMRGWVDQLYDALLTVDTVYQQKFPALYVAYHLAAFPFDPPSEDVPQGYFHDQGQIGYLQLGRQKQAFKTYDGQGNIIYVTTSPDTIRVPTTGQNYAVAQYGVYPAFRQTCVLVYHEVVRDGGAYDEAGTVTRAPWGGPPAAPPRWNKAVNDLLTAWGLTPPAAVIPASTFDDYASKQSAILSPTGWTDAERVKAGVAPVWKAQADWVRGLFQPSSLSADTYFFLLHTLIGLLTGDAATANLVEQVVTATADSPEYPNDTFINQLIYLVLMYLGDPLGPYGWNNAQLQAALADLAGVVAGVGQAAPTILTSLAQHRKILYSASAYPLSDPYNPGTGFNQRKADTLFALDKARAALHTVSIAAAHEPDGPVRRPRLAPASALTR